MAHIIWPISPSEIISPRERYLNVHLANSDTNSIDCKFKIIIHVLLTGSESPLILDIQSIRAILLQMKNVKGRVNLFMPDSYRIFEFTNF